MEELKLKLWFVCALVFLTGAAGVAVGDWDPGDGYKMHFPQVPDPCGWDICVRHQYVADDWVCDETGPVTDIHFWTSWKGDTIGFFMGWDIYIFDHDPQTGEPSTVVWSLGGIGYNYHERPAGSGEQGWFCPSEGIPYPGDHTEFYQINITDIDPPFIQQEGRRYWLVVGSPLTDRPIGWKTSQDHFGMTALWTLYATDWNPVEPEGVLRTWPSLSPAAIHRSWGPAASTASASLPLRTTAMPSAVFIWATAPPATRRSAIRASTKRTHVCLFRTTTRSAPATRSPCRIHSPWPMWIST